MVKLIFKAYKNWCNLVLYIFFPIYKNVNRILSEKQRKSSKKAGERYQNLSEEGKSKKWIYSRERYRNVWEEEKKKKCQYGRARYRNIREDVKQKFFEYRKIILKYRKWRLADLCIKQKKKWIFLFFKQRLNFIECTRLVDKKKLFWFFYFID